MNQPNPTIAPEAVSKPAHSQGCPHCGGGVQTLDKPWIGIVAVPVMYTGKFAAVFVVGILLAVAVLVWPVTCKKCGKLPLRDLPSKTRTRMILKKSFVAILLLVIVLAAQACFTAVKQI